MKVIMRVNISGTRNGIEWPPMGETVELPDAEAVDLLNARTAKPVPVEIEVATMPTAPKRQTRRRTT